ncbi:hypothetical protein [Sphingomonas crocodyli]|uniref:Uncharacterized protein n=1 Tax=Sphingomonas crocodyli TaxID=1979270 RepID=A0A437M0H3_9SPHN|nr:hypothetical protein [Sphingomonas crocodyli]RVT91148.1 hypothetical protein EOD43_16650 [Sphingomonas crocodyli]
MSVTSAYARGFGLVRTLPLLLALTFAGELLQHAVEVRLDMFAGPIDAQAQVVRLGFGAIKILTLFMTILTALRWWGFDGDLSRALRPNWRLAKGLGLVILFEIAGDLLALGSGVVALATIGDPSRGVKIAALLVPLMGWKFIAGLFYPWYVALLIEDRAMTLRRSITVMRGRLFRTFGLLIAGYIPLMVVHYALGFGAMGRSGAILWAMLVIDAGVVALLVSMLAATYYEIYLRAKAAA